MCGLGALWGLGAWGGGAARSCPTTPSRSRAARGALGAGPASGIGHVPGDGPVLAWHVGGTHGWTGQGCGELEAGIPGAGTGGPRELKWGCGLWAALGEPWERLGRGENTSYCPQAPDILYFMENCKRTKKSLTFLATPF